uniref:Uncharacterized protein n=1 Tax=Parascaris equorum TaxID=6256 RepID=A0A914RQU7_PAREQ
MMRFGACKGYFVTIIVLVVSVVVDAEFVGECESAAQMQLFAKALSADSGRFYV